MRDGVPPGLAGHDELGGEIGGSGQGADYSVSVSDWALVTLGGGAVVRAAGRRGWRLPHTRRPRDCRSSCSIAAPSSGQAGASSRIENYLGFPTGISGMALMARAYNQAQKFGVEMVLPDQV